MIGPGVLSLEEWAAIARAAAAVRQVRDDSLHGCYGDPALFRTAEARARHQLGQALSAALANAAALAEVIDAVQAGDTDIDAYSVHELLDGLRLRGGITDLLWPYPGWLS